METTYTWQAMGDDPTRMTLRNRGEPAGFSKLAAPFITMATTIWRAPISPNIYLCTYSANHLCHS
jgi:hypothetical protein